MVWKELKMIFFERVNGQGEKGEGRGGVGNLNLG